MVGMMWNVDRDVPMAQRIMAPVMALLTCGAYLRVSATLGTSRYAACASRQPGKNPALYIRPVLTRSPQYCPDRTHHCTTQKRQTSSRHRQSRWTESRST